MTLLKFIILLCSLTISVVQCSKILVIFPIAATSHYILGSALARGLAENGHEVTMISPYSEKNPPKNYREVILTGFVEEGEKMKKDMNLFEMGNLSPFLTTPFMGKMLTGICERTLQHENVQKLIHSNEKFDVVIVEQFVNDAHKALAPHFDAPLILFSTIGSNFWLDPLVGNPLPLSYIPSLLLDYNSDMTFGQRLYNSLFTLFNVLYMHSYIYPRHDELVQEYFPNPPSLYDVLYNASLVLLNSHPSTNQPVPHVPSMIEIGGFHVKPSKQLPQDLQEFLDNAKEGVVYFSMGSNLKSAQLPAQKREAILKTFAKLKMKVLWKWEEDVLPGQPANVRLGKWLPQQDILAHPNVKLFITHGGLLSTTETVYHGVPILAIPVAGDQKINAKLSESNGIGLMLPYQELTEETLYDKINEILTNPKYRENARKRSELFHDRPVSPLDTAIYWVEYVIRHRGSPHLRVAALDLPWYKYHLLDVIAFSFAVTLVFLLILSKLIKKFVRRICKKYSKKVDKDKKNK